MSSVEHLLSRHTSLKLLIVDDEPAVCQTIGRWLADAGFEADVAASGQEALDKVRSRRYALVLSDVRMPGMDGIELLRILRSLHPELPVVMLTAVDERETADSAIGAGAYGYMIKPVEENELLIGVAGALERDRLAKSENELLEQTLRGTVAMIADLLALVAPGAFEVGARVKGVVSDLGWSLDALNHWELEVAATLSQIGCVTIPPIVMEKHHRGFQLSNAEQEMIETHPTVGAKLIQHIPRLGPVAEIIAYQAKHFDGGGYPAGKRCGEQIPLGARLLHVALAYDVLGSRGMSPRECLDALKEEQQKYDPTVLAALETNLGLSPLLQSKSVTVAELREGMIIVDDVITEDGLIVVSKRHGVTPALLARITNYAKTTDIREPIRVLVLP